LASHKVILATLLLGLVGATAAQAQPFQGVYVGAGGGYNLPQNNNVQTRYPTAPQVQLQTKGGAVGVGAIGYGFGNGMRLEIEGNFRNTGISSATGPATASTSGSLQTYGVMVNGLFDMDVGSPWVYPYVGGGIGYAWTTAKNLTVFSPAPLGLSSTASGTEGRLAVQAIAGLSFPMPGVPGLSLTSEYRFFGAMGNVTFPTTVNPGGGQGNLTLRNSYNHSFMLGVRYAFGVTPPPEPAPSAVPAPAAARSYMVFFDWDKATLNDRARGIIRDAADNSSKVAYTRIEVSGFTDTSGTPKYNMGLSMRRAQAVAAELVKNKVPKEAITIQGFGDTKLLVPTGPGVREPQNRRVEIVIK